MGYFGRHWRGELSLPVAFWVNNGLLWLPLGVALGLVAAWAQAWGEGLQGAAIATLVLGAGIAFSGIWGPVGAWRSALRYRDEGGSGWWAGLTQALMALSLLGTALVLAVDVLPELPSQWRLARGHDPLGATRFELLPDGRSLRMSGPISMGASRQLSQALAQAPGVRRVLLDSPGGRLFEADAMAAQLRARGLQTRVTGTCASACTLVFLAGQPRTLAPEARLGFHRASVEGANPLHEAMANRKLAELYEAAELPPAFVRQVLRTPAWGMWFPTLAELVNASVLPAPTLRPGLDPQLPSDAPLAVYTEALADNVLWRALDQRQPGVLTHTATALHELRRGGASVAAAEGAAQTLAMSSLPQVLRGAPGPAQERFLALLTADLRQRAQTPARTPDRALAEAECAQLLARVRTPETAQAAQAAVPGAAAAASSAAMAWPAPWVGWMQASLLDDAEPDPARPLSALESEVLLRELGPRAPERLRSLGQAGGSAALSLTSKKSGSEPVCQEASALLGQVAALRGPQRRLAVRQWLQAAEARP